MNSLNMYLEAKDSCGVRGIFLIPNLIKLFVLIMLAIIEFFIKIGS